MSSSTRAMRPTQDAVKPLIAAVYRHRGEFCCAWPILGNGKQCMWWVDLCLEEARERAHADCEEMLGHIRLMTQTQLLKLRGPV